MFWFDGDVGGGDVAGANVVLICDVHPVVEHGGHALRALSPQQVSSTVEQTGTGIVSADSVEFG